MTYDILMCYMHIHIFVHCNTTNKKRAAFRLIINIIKNIIAYKLYKIIINILISHNITNQ